MSRIAPHLTGTGRPQFVAECKAIRELLGAPSPGLKRRDGAIALSLLVAMFFCGCGKKTLDQSDLKIAVGELRSQAAQVRLIAQTILTDTATSVYRRVELSLVREKIEETIQNLGSGEPKPDLEQRVRRTETLGWRVRDDLTRLSESQDRRTAREIGADLDSIIDEVLDLEASVQNRKTG
jgi:hypothetical protein